MTFIYVLSTNLVKIDLIGMRMNSRILMRLQMAALIQKSQQSTHFALKKKMEFI